MRGTFFSVTSKRRVDDTMANDASMTQWALGLDCDTAKKVF